LPLRGVFDANDHLKFRGVSFEPQWVLDLHLPQGWDVSTGLGAVLGDQKLVDTFYRVSPAEATDTRPGYDAKSGLIALRASLFISYLVNSEIRFFSFVRLDSVNGAANYNSPLVKRDNGWAAGMGLAWTLARSDAKAMD
jgi:outer membrane scaffolding protein for murein synthesis (MipA/OmpV family)